MQISISTALELSYRQPAAIPSSSSSSMGTGSRRGSAGRTVAGKSAHVIVSQTSKGALSSPGLSPVGAGAAVVGCGVAAGSAASGVGPGAAVPTPSTTTAQAELPARIAVNTSQMRRRGVVGLLSDPDVDVLSPSIGPSSLRSGSGASRTSRMAQPLGRACTRKVIARTAFG